MAKYADSYCSVEPVMGEVAFVRGIIPKVDRPLYLDDCGDTYTGRDGTEHSFCELCWQEYCGKREVGNASAYGGRQGRIYGVGPWEED